jgi:hypothetical protein
VRSIAMISSLESAEGNSGAYIGAIGERQAISRDCPDCRAAIDTRNYHNFTKMNPL